ncbi:MAG: hypothetical protein K1X78_11385 [Verrucomicrobiaceae bacterium]|nr:hypothetical protein [Verrucomicrobiaceae bacterium]
MRWLQTLHEQWMSARKRRVAAAVRPFHRDWEGLLDDAGVKTAEDRQAAQREAANSPLKLIPFKKKPRFIDKIEVPLESEAWLHGQFGTQTGAEAQAKALSVVKRWAAQPHPLLSEVWSALCRRLEAEFAIPRAVEPFRWLESERVDELLGLLFQLTSREWTEGTLIRDASTQLAHPSKYLESQQSFIERGLEQLFGRETPLESLGIQTSNSVLHFSGPLTLHFADGTAHVTDALRYESTLPVAEIERAVRITTTAKRLLTVENRKTTFLQLARADANRTTLIVATSFPTQAVRRLLEKLPSDLPHHHFGDTDPAGFLILQKLRQASPQRVSAFHMRHRSSPNSPVLTRSELRVIEQLVADPAMEDCHAPLRVMFETGRRGDFEQESLGPPSVGGWPFFE